MRLPQKDIDPNAIAITSRLRDAGHDAYIVGGAVRDLILGGHPKDTDIVTGASPGEVAALFERTVPVGARFGITVVVIDGKAYEVARFRADGVYEDGRRPTTVVFASRRQDMLRRDFTINALMYDPATCEVIDEVGGLGDVRAKVIRTIGDPEARFAEDRLRMLRAVRFAARLGFTVDPPVMAAMQQMAPMVSEVSAERIGQEIAGIVQGPHPDRGLDLLDESGLLPVILPEVAALKGVAQPPRFHPEGDVYAHTRVMLGLFGGGSLTLGFAVLLHDIGKPPTMTVSDRIRFNRHDVVGAGMAAAILRRLRMPAETVVRVRFLVENHMRLMNVPDMRESTLKRFMAAEGFGELLDLHRLDCLASHGDLGIYEFLRVRMAEESAGERSRRALPKPLIGGRDLIGLGYEPGPLFGAMLDWVYDEQLEGRVRTVGEALTAIRDSFPRTEG